MRALFLEVFYDGADEPSVSVPCLDFFGLPHGRPVAVRLRADRGPGRARLQQLPPDAVRPSASASSSSTASPRRTILYYQVDYTLQPDLPDDLGRLHVTFRRENPTVLRRDFVIADGLRGPGPLPRLQRRRAGHRPRRLVRRGRGEGLPRRRHRPADDLRHRARGLRRQRVGHGRAQRARTAARRSSVGPRDRAEPRLRRLLPLARPRPGHVRARPAGHDPADRRDVLPRRARRPSSRSTSATNPVAGEGWIRDLGPGLLAWGIAERVDDYCATAYVYCLEPQPVPRARPRCRPRRHRPRARTKQPSPLESLSGAVDPSAG